MEIVQYNVLKKEKTAKTQQKAINQGKSTVKLKKVAPIKITERMGIMSLYL